MEPETTSTTEKSDMPADTIPQLPAGEEVKSKSKVWLVVLIGLVLLALIVGAVILLMSSGSENVGKIRDIFLIFMALESLIIGIVLVILIVQLAVLINLIQNEIKPILQATNETVNTLKGTTTFLSDNLSEPVIKLNEFLAGLSKLLSIMFPRK